MACLPTNFMIASMSIGCFFGILIIGSCTVTYIKKSKFETLSLNMEMTN